MEYDIVIVGAGLAGNLLADSLAASNLKILILEAGDTFTDRSHYLDIFYNAPPDIRDMPETPYPYFPQAPFPRGIAINQYYVQTGPESQWYKGTYLRMMGGTTLHWMGTCLRRHPNDFKSKTLYQRGVDWPITYNDLEPWYGKAESALGVAGNSQIDNGAPRTQNYPMPEIPISYLAKTMQNKIAHMNFDDKPVVITPTPQARNSISGYQDRPACCGNHNCIPICPIQAKYDALVHLKMAEKKGVAVQTRSVVFKLDVDEKNNISKLHYKQWDGSEKTVTAKVYVLAAHGIEIPKLLLNSRNERFPNGIANSSDQVGRNLMDHPSQLSYALSKDPVYPLRSPLTTSGIESLYDGDFRKHRGAFRIQISDGGWSWPAHSPYLLVDQLTEKGLFGEQLNAALQQQMTRQVTLIALVELLPNPANRITLSDKYDALGIPRPQINFAIDDYVRKGFARARDLHQSIFEKMEATDIHHWSDDKWAASSHIMGTTVMGNDPKTSVVDKNLRCHDHPNLFILGSGAFPTGGCTNPSLTIAAMTLRATQPILDAVTQQSAS
jgi:choline dehydrogenase-like flavoprotein